MGGMQNDPVAAVANTSFIAKERGVALHPGEFKSEQRDNTPCNSMA